jgi:glycosyltransferase involved in cell wall biosynthesis
MMNERARGRHGAAYARGRPLAPRVPTTPRNPPSTQENLTILASNSELGLVVIGRNEGDRLRVCLQSTRPREYPVVYVDSGSTDDSVSLAGSLGAVVVPLDLSVPFTAARARNAGLQKLLELHPRTQFVQFLDGDCELDPDWLPFALRSIQADPSIALVCGRRRERFPDQSIYNALCDIEWNTPVGEAQACGGDALFRVASVEEAGRYRESLIAGEEPELCLRIRERGGKVLRLDHEMTRHDAQMTQFAQWWKRTLRAGHAYAEVSSLHAKSPFRIWKRETRSNWFWGLLIPLLAVVPAPFTWGLSLLLLLLYPLLFFRIRRRQKKYGVPHAMAYAFFGVLAKVPMMLGQWKYVRGRLFGKRSRLIEYKI